MNLMQALEITARPVPQGTAARKLFLACGFTPLHLPTFIDAHLLTSQPQQSNEFKTGVYGDLAGNLLLASSSAETDANIVVVEWPDIDARLGARALGGWRSDQSPAEELQLNEFVASFAASLLTVKNIRVLSFQKLSAHSPLSTRFDVR